MSGWIQQALRVVRSTGAITFVATSCMAIVQRCAGGRGEAARLAVAAGRQARKNGRRAR